MRRNPLVLLSAALLALAMTWWLQGRRVVDDDGQGFTVGVATRRHGPTHFRKTGEPLQEVLALFGAEVTSSAAGDVNLSGVPYATWKSLLAQSPDAEHCGSPVATQMRAAMVHRGLFATDRGVRKVLEQAVSAFDRESSSGGPRPCLEVEGTRLSGGQPGIDFLWVDAASVSDCSEIVAR